ncbi:MAG: caspase family protein [Rubrivivax sp.]
MALVVGNGAYRSLPALRNSRNDADDMCVALDRVGFQTACHRDLSTRAELRRAIQQFGAQLDSQTVGLFYYAGHGVQVQGRNYLLPTTIAPSTVAELETGGVALEEVFSVLKTARAALNIVVLDACRDDPFADARGLKVSRGLAREEPPTNSVLVYATAPGAVAVDGSGRNGLFTTHLLGELARPGPQIGEMLRGVAKLVEQEAKARYGIEQIPYRSFSYSGVFCFAQCDDTRIAEQMLALQQQSSAAVRRIQELESINAALEAARRASPQGESEVSRKANDERAAEIRTLRAQLDDLSTKSTQLEAYRQRIATLEREAREKEQQITEGARRDEQRRSRPLSVPMF